jgi:bacterioferritin
MFEQRGLAENVFLNEVLALGREVPDLEAGGTAADADISVTLLQTVLAAELVCVLRYTMMSVSPDGLQSAALGAEFQEQANDERRHMAMVAARIRQLGGVPDFNPAGVAPRIAALHEGSRHFAKCVAENLAAEQAIIARYRSLIGYFAGRDAVTCRMLEDIVRDEEDHTSDLTDLLSATTG